jgi:GTPase SAR1 family protein
MPKSIQPSKVGISRIVAKLHVHIDVSSTKELSENHTVDNETVTITVISTECDRDRRSVQLSCLPPLTDGIASSIPPSNYMKRSKGFLLTYSITSRHTFESVPSQYERILNTLSQDSFPAIIVANNSDLDDKRQVSSKGKPVPSPTLLKTSVHSLS